MTHVIVAKDTNTRTCIHSPLKEDITIPEVNRIICAIKDCFMYEWVHFDSRHTITAIEFSKYIKNHNCIMSIDAEKPRPYLIELLAYCDVVFSSKNFPKSMFPYTDNDAPLFQLMIDVLIDFCPNAKLIVTTVGERGSICVKRTNCPFCTFDDKQRPQVYIFLSY
jgi:hypothetical protein